MTSGIIFRSLPADELILNDIETAARLKTRKGYTDEVIEACRKRLIETADCRFCAVKAGIRYPDENLIDMGFGEFISKDLYTNLSGAKEAYIFAVTVGISVDRLLSRLYYTSPAEHFITDALASALAEAATDRTEEILKEGINCRRRFSPGYGDLPLELQPQVLQAVNAGRLLGITLSKALLMTPKKSITAIMGIGE